MRLPIVVALLIGTAGAAAAQNSEIGVLGGFEHWSAGAGRLQTNFYALGVEANYAWQFWERPAGRLYVELPVIVPASHRDEPAAFRVFSTPGLRYHINLHPRVAVYAAGGAGVASRVQRSAFSAAFDVGGGLDFRLSRLVSLRADCRDLLTSRKLYEGAPWHSMPGRNHLSLLFGFALHF